MHHPDGTDGPAGLIPLMLAPFDDVPDLTGIAAKDPVLDLVVVFSIRDRGKVLCIDRGPVIRVDQREEPLVGRRMLRGVKAEDAVDLIGPEQPICPVVESQLPMWAISCVRPSRFAVSSSDFVRASRSASDRANVMLA
jgi:hypothetical protein